MIIPCLNEAGTVGGVVERTRRALDDLGVIHEVIVADNGSSDESRMRALGAGARVVDTSHRKGAGAASRLGAEASSGAFLVFLDADGEHDPAEIPRLLVPIRGEGAEIVLGSRYKGEFLKGASSLPNRVLGTPVLTWLLNVHFGTRITDCNTGFRAMTRSAFERLRFAADGFEYCSEMIVRAALLGIPIVEVPITQHRSLEGRRPHLRRFRDGWRHLKFILLHAPDRVLLRPGFLSLFLGALLFFPQLGGRFEIGPIALDIHLMILGALFLIIGVEMIGCAVLSATIAGEPVAPAGRLSRRMGIHFTLDRALPVACVLFTFGFVGDLAIVYLSARQGFTGIAEPRLALLGTVGMGLAVQIAVLAFVHSVIVQHHAPERLSAVERSLPAKDDASLRTV